MKRPIAVLEFGWTGTRTVQQAFKDTIALAQDAERLGFSRFWLAQHFEADCQWGSLVAPIALIAAATRSIRVGAAGVLLNFHTAATVASDFAFLEHVSPNRIDLGLARSQLTNHPVIRQLARDIGSSAPYEQKVRQIFTHFAEEGQEYVLPPKPAGKPEIWLLGSTVASNKLAYDLSANYVHYVLHRGRNPIELRPKGARISIAVPIGGCSKSDDPHRVCGTPNAIARKLNDIADAYDASEIVVIDEVSSFDERRARLSTLARALGL